MGNRDTKFGQLLAIARVLGERVFEEGKPVISETDWKKYPRQPAETFAKLHTELMEYAHKFGSEEIALMDLFGEIIDGLGAEGFTNEPLNNIYIHGYYTQGDELNNMIGAEDAAKLWGLTAGTVKNYCAEGRVKAKKIGKTWVIDKRQNNPSDHSK